MNDHLSHCSKGHFMFIHSSVVAYVQTAFVMYVISLDGRETSALYFDSRFGR